VTLSLKVTFQATLEAFVGFAFARLIEETVGAVLSAAAVVAVEEFDALLSKLVLLAV